MIPLKTHSILDYVAGVLLLVIPSVFGLETIASARNLFLLCGAALIGYSLLTKYPYSAWKIIPLGTHMTLDVAIGVILILAPWVLGYRNLLTAGQEVIHYAMGLGTVGLVAITRAKTEAEKRAQEPTYPGRFSASGRT